MKTYSVEYTETSCYGYTVTADSQREAIVQADKLVRAGVEAHFVTSGCSDVDAYLVEEEPSQAD